MLARNNRLYEAIAQESIEGRELEARVLLKAAGRLQSCATTLKADRARLQPEDFSEALRYNQRLWTLLQVEMGTGYDRLPDDLRRNVLLLSGFVDRATLQLLAQPEPGKLDTLIRINVNLAEGLLAKPEGATAEAARPEMAEAEPVGVGLDLAF